MQAWQLNWASARCRLSRTAAAVATCPFTVLTPLFSPWLSRFSCYASTESVMLVTARRAPDFLRCRRRGFLTTSQLPLKELLPFPQ